MARNIEIKARARNFASMAAAASLSDTPGTVLEQRDTFFHVSDGRLKLREARPGGAELIFYHRGNCPEARLSEYSRAAVADATVLKHVLASALGICGEVKKQRRLYHSGQTRIHLDCVEGLGEFLELEYVLREGEAESAGRSAVEELSRQLGVEAADLLAPSYAELLAEKADGR